MGLDARKPVLEVCKQQRHRPDHALRSLISAFVIRLLESIMSEVATREIPIF